MRIVTKLNLHSISRVTTISNFLINLGGYCPDEFGELHRYKFVVAQSASEAKQQAKTLLPTFWQKATPIVFWISMIVFQSTTWQGDICI